MFKLFHGTTLKGAKDIINNGYDCFKSSQAWSCSNPKHIYFYNPIKIIENELNIDLEDCNTDNWNIAESNCIELAKESGDIQNALQNNPDNQVCVLEFIFDKDIELEALNWLGEDYSCEYMNLASVLPVDFINDCIKNKKIAIVTHYFNFWIKLSLFYLVSLTNNAYFSLSLEKMSKEDYNILMLLKGVDYPHIIDTILTDTQEEIDKTYWNYNF